MAAAGRAVGPLDGAAKIDRGFNFGIATGGSDARCDPCGKLHCISNGKGDTYSRLESNLRSRTLRAAVSVHAERCPRDTGKEPHETYEHHHSSHIDSREQIHICVFVHTESGDATALRDVTTHVHPPFFPLLPSLPSHRLSSIAQNNPKTPCSVSYQRKGGCTVLQAAQKHAAMKWPHVELDGLWRNAGRDVLTHVVVHQAMSPCA